MANSIKALAVRINNIDMSAGKIISINCQNTSVKGQYWRKPVTGRGIQSGYSLISADNGVAKPTPDSLRVLHLRNDQTNENIYIALADSGDVNDFTSRCNACCDDITDMPTVVIPDVIIEETACPDSNDNRNFFTIVDALGAGEVYDVHATLNGVEQTRQDAGFDAKADIETFGDANWAPATVSISGDKITLTSATATTGSLTITRKKKFESNTPGALSSGQHYSLAATINGVVLAPINGAADAALSTIATAANANVNYAYYGRWSVVAGKIRLVSAIANTATLAVTKS